MVECVGTLRERRSTLTAPKKLMREKPIPCSLRSTAKLGTLEIQTARVACGPRDVICQTQVSGYAKEGGDIAAPFGLSLLASIQTRGGAHMPDDRCRLGSDDVVIGLDLASAEHQAVVFDRCGAAVDPVPDSPTRAGLENLLRRTTPAALGRAGDARVFAFEATGHLWEAVASALRGFLGERCPSVADYVRRPKATRGTTAAGAC